MLLRSGWRMFCMWHSYAHLSRWTQAQGFIRRTGKAALSTQWWKNSGTLSYGKHETLEPWAGQDGRKVISFFHFGHFLPSAKRSQHGIAGTRARLTTIIFTARISFLVYIRCGIDRLCSSYFYLIGVCGFGNIVTRLGGGGTFSLERLMPWVRPVPNQLLVSEKPRTPNGIPCAPVKRHPGLRGCTSCYINASVALLGTCDTPALIPMCLFRDAPSRFS